MSSCRAGAASTRVSNALGEGRPDAARLAALVATLLTLVAIGSIVVAVVLSRQQLGGVFSNDAAVISLGASVMPILGAALIGDGANGVLSGAVTSKHLARRRM
jgi:multidrug resistance protein, MATE family